MASIVWTPTQAQSALSVVDKLICRGHVTLLAEPLETALNRPSTPALATSSRALTPSLDSDDERAFWTNWLPILLGPAFSTWCTPQVDISTLTNGEAFQGTQQRVDFVIAHPSLERPLIVEIDGAQHSGSIADDARRTQHLEASGYRIVRIPVSELRAQSGISIDSIRQLLAPLKAAERSADVHSAPIRRAGQIQLAILHALFVGLAPGVGNVTVSTDLVGAAELTHEEVDLIVRDLAGLLQRVGQLYGIGELGSGMTAVSADTEAHLHLSFYGGGKGRVTVLVEDTYLPFPIKWTPRPVQFAAPVALDAPLLRYFLTRVFRKPDFRDGQLDIVVRALRAKDTIALLPTGAGKSIAFQLAGLLLPGRTIVVAPLLSLIRDQIYNLASYGIDRALAITSDLSDRGARDRASELLKHGEALFYYIAPERFQIAEFRQTLRGMTAAFPVNLIVVDEAHCVSEWGHDFRTAYLRIGRTSRECSSSGGRTPALIALTGTASRAVLRDLQRELQVMDFEAVVTPTSFDRAELQYAVLHEASSDKPYVLQSYLRNALPSLFGVPPEVFFRLDGERSYCGLVFCPHVQGPFGVVEVAHLLNAAGINAEYHAGSRPKSFQGSEREWKAKKNAVERSFKRNEIGVLVSTKAFGMGVDKPNVRFTIHYGIPASIEAFYQEAGRAGRDGHRAVCTAIVSDDRTQQNRRLLAPATPVEEVATFVEKTPYEDNDDVSRMLYFHVRSFKGVDAEIASATGAYRELSPTGSRASRQVPFGADATVTEKALHRLVIVGVVEDYTVDYSARRFAVTLADATHDHVTESYCGYVASYQGGRAEQERRRVVALARDWDAFVLGVVELYIRFVYDVIERGRRRAIAEVLAACQVGSGEDLRRRILDYLEQAEFSEAVEVILGDSRGGLSVIPGILADIISPNDAARLRGPVARSLETYPDHPGLLVLRAVSEALSRDTDEQTVRENFEAFLVNAANAYGLSAREIAATTGAVLRIVSRKNVSGAEVIERTFLLRFHDRDALRWLVSGSGLAATRVAPWVLLYDMPVVA